MSPVQALELLDSNFPDSRVRDYAIKILEQLNDGDLADYLLQLIQVKIQIFSLKNENFII